MKVVLELYIAANPGCAMDRSIYIYYRIQNIWLVPDYQSRVPVTISQKTDMNFQNMVPVS